MKKKLFITGLIFLICLTMLPLSAYAAADQSALLSDGADLLTESEEQELLAELNRIREAYQVDVIVVTMDSLGTYSPDSYVEYLYDSQGYGYGANQDGVLLLVAMEERDYRILANGFGSDAISYSELDELCDAVAQHLSDENYAEAFQVFAEECEYQINGEINGFPFDFTTNLLIALGVGLVVALIVTAIMLSQLKSVKPKRGATVYTKAEGMQMTRSSDRFLYRTVSRIRRETNSSSSGGRSYGGGGSSRKVGGGKF